MIQLQSSAHKALERIFEIPPNRVYSQRRGPTAYFFDAAEDVPIEAIPRFGRMRYGLFRDLARLRSRASRGGKNSLRSSCIGRRELLPGTYETDNLLPSCPIVASRSKWKAPPVAASAPPIDPWEISGSLPARRDPLRLEAGVRIGLALALASRPLRCTVDIEYP